MLPCRQASKREAQARATALKEKERQDKERFKEKRKEERAHKKVQAQRMKQERATAKKSTTNVGIFGFLGGKPSKKKEEPMEKPKATPTEADAVGGQTVAAGPSQAGNFLFPTSVLDSNLQSNTSLKPEVHCTGRVCSKEYANRLSLIEAGKMHLCRN